MKVLHVSTAISWRGGEQQIAYLTDELSRKGIEQMVVCPSGSALQQYCMLHHIPFCAIKKRAGIDFLFMSHLAGITRRFRPDIIHLHDAHAHTAAIIAAVFFGISLPMVLHRRVTFETGKNIFTRYKYNHPLIKKIICISEAVKKQMLHLVREDKLTVIHSAADCQRFAIQKNNQLRNEFGLSSDVKIIGNIAAFTKEKNWVTFVEAAALLKQQLPDVKFVAIGEGPELNNIKAQIQKLGLHNDIILTGFRKDIENILPEFDLLLFTSENEGLGTTILDAFCCRVPVVASDAGGISELVVHEKTGLLCSPHNASAFAESVVSILKNDSLRQSIIESAHRKTSEFTKEAMAQKVMEVYLKSIASFRT
jgi:glycosyltransferase involved in cell wall biosynthesis